MQFLNVSVTLVTLLYDSVFLALTFGGGLVKNVVSVLNGNLKWLGNGLSVAGAVLPAVGFAILLRYLPVKKSFISYFRLYDHGIISNIIL